MDNLWCELADTNYLELIISADELADKLADELASELANSGATQVYNPNDRQAILGKNPFAGRVTHYNPVKRSGIYDMISLYSTTLKLIVTSK